jgi:hypothetical protein
MYNLIHMDNRNLAFEGVHIGKIEVVHMSPDACMRTRRVRGQCL